MVSRCANPLCSKSFHYLSEGKIFQVEVESDAGSSRTSGRKRPGKIERFWLCSDCAVQMTLVYGPGSGVTVAPLSKIRRAIAS